MSDTPPVVATDVVKHWGATPALAGATFTIGRGVTGLLGANGAGKTTLLGLILGMHAPDEGSLSVLGQNPATAGPVVRARIGYAPEHDAMPPDVSAHDFVRHVAELHGLPSREATARASDTLYEVGLGEERFRQIGTMSTGQRQRVKLAQAIAHDPDLVLLDEPTNGLDPEQREHMIALIRRVGTTLGHDVVISSHLLDEVERVSDAVVILDAGRTVATGDLSELSAASEEVHVELTGVHAADEAQRLAAALVGAGLEARADGRIVVTTIADDTAFDVLRDLLASSSVAPRRVQRRRASLEDVFFAGTGGTQ